jgi:hypothetical protein
MLMSTIYSQGANVGCQGLPEAMIEVSQLFHQDMVSKYQVYSFH